MLPMSTVGNFFPYPVTRTKQISCEDKASLIEMKLDACVGGNNRSQNPDFSPTYYHSIFGTLAGATHAWLTLIN